MKQQSFISLAPFTSFHIGGPASVFIEASTEEDVVSAINHARELNLPIFTLGAGTNLLVPDEGVKGVVLKINLNQIVFEKSNEEVVLIGGAGTLWEKIIDATAEKELFGIENLAGIPGTLGGACVQNIGAYGAELSSSFLYADCINTKNFERIRISLSDASFDYRTSFFKKNREYIILYAALRFSKKTLPNITYPDLIEAANSGINLTTPYEIAKTIRSIRAEKFPYSNNEGTGGSFFKNPVITRELADSLALKFPGLPIFQQKNGSVKIPLAWILDHVLSLKGFSNGNVRLYEKQPLIIVANSGATASEVNNFADEIERRVFNATGIRIEREVETFGS